MLKRRRSFRFKRNVLFSSTNRRRIMRKSTHNKILWRRRMFAMQQMEELDKLEQQLSDA